MAELVTTGTWMVKPGQEVAFTEAWAAFAEWASSMPGARALRLGRDTGDPQRYVSYGPWADAVSVREWKGSPEFRARIGRVLQYVDDFRPAELDVVATAEDGTSALTLPA
jgi:monooxygenase